MHRIFLSALALLLAAPDAFAASEGERAYSALRELPHRPSAARQYREDARV